MAGTGDRAGMLSVIRNVHAEHGYVLDPHTAVGVAVARQHLDPGEPMICLATAHPAKFGAVVEQATGQAGLARHSVLDGLAGRESRMHVLPPEVDKVKAFIRDHAA